MLKVLVARSRQNVARSGALCAHSLSLVTLSGALLRYSRSPAGASDAAIPTRASRTLDKTSRGDLPPPAAVAKTWAATGSLMPCSGCNDKIELGETECGIQLATPHRLRFLFHAECYRAWLSLSTS